MPKPGLKWRHIALNTHNSWLPGAPRGFRSYEHKIHSSGDYKTPPPPGEHAGLNLYSRIISTEPVKIPDDFKRTVGVAILRKLRKLEYRCLVISVGAMHCHFQAELPDDLPKIRQIVGQCKTVSSHAIRDVLPGRVWGRDCSKTPIDDPEHHRNVFYYILGQEDAWKWSYRDGIPDET